MTRRLRRSEKTAILNIGAHKPVVGVDCRTQKSPNYLPELLHTQQDQRERLHGARKNGADCDFKTLILEAFENTIRTV